MPTFDTQFEGELEFNPLPEDFVTRLTQRVETGWAGRSTRFQRRVVNSSPYSITIRTQNPNNPEALGGNEITLSRQSGNTLHYAMAYHSLWWFTAIHGLMVAGGMGYIYSLTPAMQRSLAASPVGFATYWGVVALVAVSWPWLITAAAREMLRASLVRILRDTLTEKSAARTINRAA